MSVEEWLTKASWEGGILEAISIYGLSHKNLDPTEDSEIYKTIKRVSKKA